MNQEIDVIINNEKEWRRYMVKKIDNLEKEFGIFKIKAFSFMAVMSFILNVAVTYVTKVNL